MSDEAKVLNCLLLYCPDAMKDILPKYSYNYDSLIAKLKHYPGKSLYHGHGTQGAGAAVAGAAQTNQAAAIKFLSENAPPAIGGNTKTGKHPQELINRNRTGMLLKIIKEDETNNLGEIDRKLSVVNPDWRQDRDVNGTYESIRLEKKRLRDEKKRS